MIRDTIQREIDTITKQIVDVYQPEKIILFGSAARGDMRRDSDLDFLIIKKSTKKSLHRMQEVYKILRNISRECPIDILVYTPEELQRRLDLGDFFIQDIMYEGKVLHG